MEIRTPHQIRAALLAKGLSCRAWAKLNGYQPRTVQLYICQFAPSTGRIPKRPLARKIMAGLSVTTGVDLLGEA